ncbi:MAG TPA: ATP-binding cassette domain-containing protein, partial [Lautropia sp.]|nr:ATP-binding cassette domain-containing protein [Lautropia sp.]
MSRGFAGVPVPALAVVVLLALAPWVLPQFYVTLLNYVGLYSLVALGLVLLTGVAGQISFGQAAFVGVGAYATAVLTSRYGFSPWVTLPIALALTVLVAWLLGLITLRMSGHFLPLGTIAWGVSLYYLFGTVPLLGGFGGLSDIPTLSIGGFEFLSLDRYFYLIWGVTLAALWASANLLDSRTGRAMRTLKARATMAEAFGVVPSRLRIQVFIFAALLAALSGWLFAHMQRFINPTPFSINMGIEYLFMAVVGGAGSVWGAVLGALLITILKEVLQARLPGLIGQSGPFEIIVFGVLILLLLHHARDGVWPVVQRLLPARPRRNVDGESSLPSRTQIAGGQPLLAVREARKQFGGLVAVNQVSFEMRSGEILGLIGPNGAGKSTLFNLISGYAPLSAGEVSFNGRRISGLDAVEIARLGIARTFQHVKLISQMSVLDNVAVGAYLRGSKGMLATCIRLDREEEAELLREAARHVRRVGLEAQMHEP